MPQLESDVIAYIAGFLDGEGEIGIHKLNEPKRSRSKIRHRLEVAITNNCKEILLFIQSLYGGNIHKKKRYEAHHKQTYRWRIEGQPALKFLKDIYPYLRLKKTLAVIAFEFGKSLRTIGGNTRRPISPYILNKREDYYNRIKALNFTKDYYA